MKKFLAIVLCMSMLFALAACSAKKEGSATVASPITEMESLEDLNKAVGGKLCKPGVMGVTDEIFQLIDCGKYKIEEYRFTLNGYAYNFRCAKVKTDISGLYVEEGTAFKDGKAKEMQYADAGEYKAARWFAGNMQYVFSVKDGGEMEKETFLGIAEEMQSLCK